MNSRYFILVFMVSVFSAIVFLASYKDLQSVYANPQVMKDQMNKTGMMDQKPMQIQKMMKQMNKTGMMDGND